MSMKNRSKRLIAGGAAAVGLTLGAGALAGAASQPTQTAPDQPAAEADGEHDENLNGSIQAPEDESLSEADEAKALEGLATISSSDAEAAAVAAVPGGTVNSVELGNENGSVVYEVDMTDANGQSVEVKVDAGNGDVLDTETGDDEAGDESGESEADEANEAPEANEASEVTPAK